MNEMGKMEKIEKIVITEMPQVTIPDGTYEAEFIGAITSKRKTIFGEKMATVLKFRIVSGAFEGNILSRVFYWPQPQGIPIVTKGCALGKAIKEITGKNELDETAIGNLVFIRVENKQLEDGRIVANIINVIRHPDSLRKQKNNTSNKSNIQMPVQQNVQQVEQPVNQQQSSQTPQSNQTKVVQEKPIDFSDFEI
jgi:hypothetical protein